jgi:hypothetical protein
MSSLNDTISSNSKTCDGVLNEFIEPIVFHIPALGGFEAVQYLQNQSRYHQSPLIDSEELKTYIRNTVRERMRSDKAFINAVAVREIRRRHSVRLILVY